MADLSLRRRAKKRVLAPEYGGDGGKKVGDCDKFDPPVDAFPADLGTERSQDLQRFTFPKDYQGGAFIALPWFMESSARAANWLQRRVPAVLNGKSSGEYIVFADGFAGKYKDPGRATYRPSGLAAGPDGALYITDDKAGRIWRVTYVEIPTRRVFKLLPFQQRKPKPRLVPCHRRAFIPTRELNWLTCQCHPGRQTSRSHSARRSSMARSQARPAPDVTALMAWARRWEPI